MAGSCVITMVMMTSLVVLLRDQAGVSSAPAEPESDAYLNDDGKFLRIESALEDMRKTITSFKGNLRDLEERVLNLQINEKKNREEDLKEKTAFREQLDEMETSVQPGTKMYIDSKLRALVEVQDKLESALNTTNNSLEDMRGTITSFTALKRDLDDMRQLSTTVDALKHDQDDMRQLSATVDALKRDQDDISTTVDALKRDQDNMRQLSTTVDALKRDQDDMRQLSATVDALKRDQDDMSATVDALKRDQDDMSAIVDALKRDQDDMSATVDALKRDQDDMSATVDALKRDQNDMRQLSTTVDALKRDQDDMRLLSTTVDALKRDQDDISTTVDALKRDLDDIRQLSTTVDALKRDRDDMRQLSTTVDALKRDLDSERSRVTALEQRLQEMPSCPTGYTVFRGICYKAFDTPKSFSDAAAACGEDGGTLAMPQDAETNAFLISLHNAVSDKWAFWFGLHDQWKEGSFEWVDGSALGTYNSWDQGQPDSYQGNADCAAYSVFKDKWAVYQCDWTLCFICQAVPGRH
ncbi:uncharacterized protein LOC144859522 [Branchiostoma floridae x Branchiostoma japonicum]